MQSIFLFVIIALMVKDPLGDSYILRTLSQGLCLLAGMYIFLMRGRDLSTRKYLPLILFIVSSGISALLGQSKVYAGLQTISLGAIVLFFIAYNEVNRTEENNQKPVKIFVILAIILIIISLLLIKNAPEFVYYYNEFEGNRLRGLFTNPETLAATAGLTWGLWIFSDSSEVSVLSKILSTLILLPALLLTGSRTYWVACFVAAVVVLLWIKSYMRFRWNIIYVSLGFLGLFGVSSLLLIVDVKQFGSLMEKHSRMESIDDFSGRTTIWESAFERFNERPIFGNGLCAGDDAFKVESSINSSKFLGRGSPTEIRSTLHNGFIQVLLDAGVVGFVFYCLTLAKSFYNLIVNRKKEYAAPLYAVTFSIIANMGQSFIFGAGTFLGIITWYYITFGLSISKTR
jgi:O-antigen ligase